MHVADLYAAGRQFTQVAGDGREDNGADGHYTSAAFNRAQPTEGTTTEPVPLEKPRQVFPFTATMIACSILSVALELLGVICIIRVCKTIGKKDGDNECSTQ